MYKVDKIQIDGFWHRLNAMCDFNLDVNIIIGHNGTGKTTFMNILYSVLTADVMGLSESDFISAKVILVNGKRKKTIQVEKYENDKLIYQEIEYRISGRKKRLRLFPDERRLPISVRNRLLEQANEVREELAKLVSVSSLSVYRLRNDDDYEVRDRHGSRVLSPVDYRLTQVLRELTEFQFALSQKAQLVSQGLQKDVLVSILYDESDASEVGWDLSFDKDDELKSLTDAYNQLNAFNPAIKKKINFHVDSIGASINKFIGEHKRNIDPLDVVPLEARRKTRKIIDLSLKAKEETKRIYSQIDTFLKILETFILDKKFTFYSGKLEIKNDHGPINHTRLSSGEKQLIILMVEALLQNQQPHIFLADEPELSLHISWQRQIIPAIREINPNGQVIVATHSPEVAAKYKDFIFDMENLVNE